ncbi:MAG: hypothetical protein L0212_00780 [Acidobacteria bacterium]|nr:hypothetical protein [Acidobacteriota bacterium]
MICGFCKEPMPAAGGEAPGFDAAGAVTVNADCTRCGARYMVRMEVARPPTNRKTGKPLSRATVAKIENRPRP